ncbi:MAG: hypothetical protein KatS3mg053_2016 [Candidatus Roseilinea sp.]|nr:MAG: hypothetical protein KatS3mg053_2016 [Candidatus Roseilinea sp.]
MGRALSFPHRRDPGFGSRLASGAWLSTVTTPLNAERLHISEAVGEGVHDLSFQLRLKDDERNYSLTDFDWTVAHDGAALHCLGSSGPLRIAWTFTSEREGYWVQLVVECDEPFHCAEITNLIVTYAPQTADLTEWWVPNFGESIDHVGLFRVRELSNTPGARIDKVLRGAFQDEARPGLFLGTRFPQTHAHWYSVSHDAAGLKFTSTTKFAASAAPRTRWESEQTWVCANKSARDALDAYAGHLPRRTLPRPPVGWNSWDYYFSSISLEDLIENMDAIRRHPLLSAHVKIIVLDMGWEHLWGEWEPNYRFPGGLERVVREIRQRGFIPGIWTAPIQVHAHSKTGLRRPELLLKNQHGDPIASHVQGHYVLDPTSPNGEAFVRNLFTRLYMLGFRFFKIDFLNDLCINQRLHRADFGPYDAMRRLFEIVRECVTEDSHILGCSLPPEAGAGVADSGRIGIDIHNQWTHVEWVCDYLQWSYWLHGRVWINDPDFLVVRGRDTSLEPVINVTNPNAHHPNPPRWRRGPEFTLDEARTWASIVAMAGGNVFLGDRITQLNEAAYDVIGEVIKPTGVAAQPLDLCAARRASLWFQSLPNEHRLTVINWSDVPLKRVINFAALGLAAPTRVVEMWSRQTHEVRDGCVTVELPPHACAVLRWQ